MAALEIKVEELQVKQQKSERNIESLRKAPPSSMASTHAGPKRPRVAGTTGSLEHQQFEPGRLWASGCPRAVLEILRRSA
eukprot:8606663-Pyramimonas_sp.AAC.1